MTATFSQNTFLYCNILNSLDLSKKKKKNNYQIVKAIKTILFQV